MTTKPAQRQPAPKTASQVAFDEMTDAIGGYIDAIQTECRALREINAQLGQDLKHERVVLGELRRGYKVLLDAIDTKTAIIAECNVHLQSLYNGGAQLARNANDVAASSDEEIKRLAALAAEPPMPEPTAPRWIAPPQGEPTPPAAMAGQPDITALGKRQRPTSGDTA